MDIQQLVQRAKLQNITLRAQDLDDVRDMLAGQYTPQPGYFAPAFKPGTSREQAWLRAIRATSTIVPIIINKSLAAIDFGGITWSDAEDRAEEVDMAVRQLDLAQIASDLAVEFKLTGVAAAIASTPLDSDGNPMPPTVNILYGLNIPYSDPRDPSRISGWYRAVEYGATSLASRLRWWVETYDWNGTSPGDAITHRVWQALTDPTSLAVMPDDEFMSTARPRYILNGLGLDGLPISPILQNMGRILGLYATELRLTTTEELAAFPMFMTKGEAELDAVGPGESVAVETAGDARWLDPGKLEELREQVKLKRDQIREAFNLPGGSLGNTTPSGEALAEANRSFMQETQGLASMLGGLLTELVNDYLTLLELPTVSVSVPVDRAYSTNMMLPVIEKGVDLGAIPAKVAARAFQSFVGDHYSDEELREFIEQLDERNRPFTPGLLSASDVA